MRSTEEEEKKKKKKTPRPHSTPERPQSWPLARSLSLSFAVSTSFDTPCSLFLPFVSIPSEQHENPPPPAARKKQTEKGSKHTEARGETASGDLGFFLVAQRLHMNLFLLAVRN